MITRAGLRYSATAWVCGGLLVAGCGGGGHHGTDAGGLDAGTDAPVPMADAGAEAGMDAAVDGGRDAGTDAGPDASSDAGPADGGPTDAGPSMDAAADAAADAGTDAGPTDFDAAVLATGPDCPCSFCWSHPLPDGEDLDAAWGSGGRVWIGGGTGVLDYWDGSAMRRAPRASADVLALSGVTPRDVHALLASDTVLHWDGSTWAALPSPGLSNLTSVSADGAGGAWVVDNTNRAAHFDGTTWTSTSPARPAAFRKVWAAGPDEAWGIGAAIEHVTAGTWTREASSVSGFVWRDAWGSSANDVWFAGGSGMRLYHWDGSSLSPVTTVGMGPTPDLVGGTGPSDIWAVASVTGDVVHFDGTAWSASTLPAGLDVRDLTLAAPGEPWVVGHGGQRARYHGGAWELVGGVSTGTVERLWASADDDVWATTYDTGPLHWDGTAWAVRSIGVAPLPLEGVFGFGPDDVWVSSNVGAYHWDGSGWTMHPLLLNMTAIWGASSNDVWFVAGGGRAAHWNGSALTEVLPSPSSSTLNDVWGFAADDVWAVGAGGTIVHDAGSGFSPVTSPTSELLDTVWGAAPNDLWVGGANGALFHWDGSTWTDRSLGMPITVRAVRGRSSDDVTIVLGVRPALVYHWDGSSLTSETCTAQAGNAVWETSTGTWLGVLSGILDRMP